MLHIATKPSYARRGTAWLGGAILLVNTLLCPPKQYLALRAVVSPSLYAFEYEIDVDFTMYT